MKQSILSIIILFIAWTGHAMKISDLTCEMKQTPLAVETEHPRFGWKLTSDINNDKQTSYQLILSSKGKTVWNTGKVKSGESQLIAYKGKALEAGTRYTWTVKVWDTQGKAHESEPSFFETAPAFDTNKTQWIGAITREDSRLPMGRRDMHNPSVRREPYKSIYENINPLALRSILLRKSFNTSKKLEKAIVHVSGLGHYKLSINGEDVSNDIFAPAWSDYDKTVYYNTYQVDDLLQSGENVMGITLGNGFYNAVGIRYRKLWVTFGPPTLFLEMHLHYTDGSHEVISSDASWKYALSPITFNDIYGGEDYDARLEQQGWDAPRFNDHTWKPVVVQGAPQGILRAQQLTNVKRMEQFGAVSMTKIDTSFVLDMGQNLAGYPAIKVIGKKGQTLKLTLGELLDSETGLVSQRQSGGPHTYSYTLKGEGIEEWHPEFSYYGYQYIQVDGANLLSQENPDKPLLVDIKSNFIYNSTGERGHFESSNELFNRAHVLIKNAVKSNMQAVFSDCPHREKLGWLEQTHLNGPGLLYNWDMTQFYPKIMRDMADRSSEIGYVPTTAPEYVTFDASLNVFRDSPEWGIASCMLPWLYYQYYGDDTLLRNYFELMKTYVDHMTSRADNHITSHGLGDWYDYGEHRAGFSKNSPVEVSSTAHYYYAAHLVEKAAKHLNKKAEAKTYGALARNIKQAFNDKFFQPSTKQYGNGSQFCNAIALFMHLVDTQDRAAVLENLKADIVQRGNRLTTGDVGNRYLFMALALNGENELMYLMHNHYDAPGYGFQIKQGVTTLTEQWDPRKGASWNHFMMGQIDEWFFHSLAGIVPSANGFKEFTIQPRVVGDLTWVKANHTTLYGDIQVEWQREGDSFTLQLQVPVNTVANVVLPDGKKQRVGSGKMVFTTSLPAPSQGGRAGLTPRINP